MRYMRTQIYLDPDEHRKLVEEARARGMSLTALIRKIVSEFIAGERPLRTRGFDPLIAFAEGEITDVASAEKAYAGEALEARLRRKLGRTQRSTTGRRRRDPG